MVHLLDLQIKDAAPHIFRRPFLYVEQNTRMMQLATFLAIGPQIYVDGLVVIGDEVQGRRPIGKISSKHIISSIRESGYSHWLQSNASQIMDKFVMPLSMDSHLKSALEVFETTRFAFVPILAMKDDKTEAIGVDPSPPLSASFAIRDILPLIVSANLNTQVKEISSRLMSVDAKTSIRNAIDYMLNKSIRNIGIKNFNGNNGRNRQSKLPYIINDRKILEFLLSHNGRHVLYKNGVAGLADITINNLEIISPKIVKSNTAVSIAAELLMDIHNPCLILEQEEEEYDYIVTPWDIVMKTLQSNEV